MYSDFPGDALDVLARYYDAMFYIANWGSVKLAFRFPRDYRILYLSWLTAVWDEWELEDEAPEPPVPAGLQTLSAPLQAFVDLFAVDERLLKIAAAVSPTQSPTPTPDLEAAVSSLPPDEQQAWLVRLAQGELHLRQKFNRRLGELTAVDASPGQKTGRSAGDLRRAIEDA